MTIHSRTPWKCPSIQTYLGKEFYPLDPKLEDIHIVDIAHAISMKCRYTGHSRFFYSVAQHSVLLTRYIRHELENGAIGTWVDPNPGHSDEDALDVAGSLVKSPVQRWALMHDASEAYLPDVAGPIKAHINGFIEIENRLLEVIAERFKLGEHPKDLSFYDRMMYWREREVLLDRVDWVALRQDVVPVPARMRLLVPIESWSPERAKNEFMHEFIMLFGFDQVSTPWRA